MTTARKLLSRVAPTPIKALYRQLVSPQSPARVFQRWRRLSGEVLNGYSLHGLELFTGYPGKVDRQIVVIQCLRSLRDLPGDVVEFGTYKGHTAIHMAQQLKQSGDPATLYLFDSFQGLPKSTVAEDSAWQPGQFSASLVEVQQRFAPFRVEIVAGFFEDTIPQFAPRPIKFAHVDCDLYTSTKTVNAWLLGNIVPGGIVVYDDYGFASCPGAMKAVDEDLRPRRDYLSLFLPTGQLVAVKR